MALSEKAQKVIETGVKALEDKKAEDITVIDISEISIIADALVIASGNNKKQIQACEETTLLFGSMSSFVIMLKSRPNMNSGWKSLPTSF